jgi:hypothetical protein
LLTASGRLSGTVIPASIFTNYQIQAIKQSINIKN